MSGGVSGLHPGLTQALIEVDTPPLSVNRLISAEVVLGRAQDAAAALPAGSARTVVAELRDAALKLLGLHLKRSDTPDEDTDTLNRCQSVGDLAAGSVREILHAADHVLCDRYWIKRASLDQGVVSDRRADEHLQLSERRDNSLDRIHALVESLHQLVRELEVVGDAAGVERVSHEPSPSVGADSPNVEGERPGPDDSAPGPGHLRTAISDTIWSLGRAVHRLADRIWNVSDRLIGNTSEEKS